jgi:alkylation response protein AidB-like acyl-CoA dehydrogenase
MDFNHSEKTQGYIKRVKAFMDEHIYPVEEQIYAETHKLNPDGDWQNWQAHPLIEPLKKKAQEAGLWNLFLPDATLGKGLTTLEYAPLAEQMGRVLFASEIFNCNAPDTGNMEVLYHFGNEYQQDKWLKPLLAGEIRSVFGMTEPDVASSDATNMQATVELDGDELVLNGKKWWTTGLGHPNAKIAIFMALSNPENDKHSQHSMVVVPLDSPGIEIKRMLQAYGDYDAPFGHGEMHFTNVRVPKENLLVGMGKGFAIAQGRLGPGRIHHCMRSIGVAQRALDLMCQRVNDRIVFGRPMIKQQSIREDIAISACQIEQARLMTLKAAQKMDLEGNKAAKDIIAMIKIVAPSMSLDVLDRAIQCHGAVGVSQDTFLAHAFAGQRTLRLADGPDQVHMMQLGRDLVKKST